MRKINFKNMKYKTQIFFVSLLLVCLPTTIAGIINARKNANTIVSDYNESQMVVLSQTNLALDTSLSDATKVANLPLLNTDLKHALSTNYGSNYLKYAQDSTKFKEEFNQTNRLNKGLVSCVFINKYNYTFEYNTVNVAHQELIQNNISEWEKIANESSNSVYFAPPQRISLGTQHTVLPMVKILYDPDTYKKTGLCYAEIDFNEIETVFQSVVDENNSIFIYDSNGNLYYSSDAKYSGKSSDYKGLLSMLSSFSSLITNSSGNKSQTMHLDGKTYIMNGCFNATTGWTIVQLMNNSVIQDIYNHSFFSSLNVFMLSILFGLILAIIFSNKLSSSISKLCSEIDTASMSKEPTEISMTACGSNKELRKLVSSFNNMNQRLYNNMQQNYKIKLREEQTKIQMLQFQINHHFLYNTLNVIRSLANIHNVPEISEIAMSMSDLMRYNLTKFPKALLFEEAEQANRYMAIQNIRFPGKFTFYCLIPEPFRNISVPSFILQPLVENSIEHGFQKKDKDCIISISCKTDDLYFHIIVADNGTGINKQTLGLIKCSLETDDELGDNKQHTSIGIKNVHQRIKSTYGNKYGLVIDSFDNQGTIIDIRLPK